MKTPRKLTALILMGALTASSIAAVPASAKTFSDVPSNHWAYKIIDEISNDGIMIGTGTNVFSPNTQLTRAEYTAVLYNIAPDKSNGTFTIDYTDVKDSDWFADAVKWAVSNGIITVKDKKFEPQTPISREEMANTTYSFLAKNYYDLIEHNRDSAGYADQDKITTGFTAAINILTNNGLLAGRGNNMFEPQGTLTRAEAAAMASRMTAIIDQSDNPAGETEDPNNPSEPENPGGETEDPNNPSEPENPGGETEDPNNPSEPENPGGETEDPNDPSNWDLDGAPSWFLVGNPGSFSDEQWTELITYWEDKNKPADYPSKIPSVIKTETQAKAYFESYLQRLYDYMQEADAISQLEAGTVSLSDEDSLMVEMVNNARAAVGAPELKSFSSFM